MYVVVQKPPPLLSRFIDTLSHWLPTAATKAHVPPPGIECLRCRRPAGGLSLLTADTAYYACVTCLHRWSIVRTGAGGVRANSNERVTCI